PVPTRARPVRRLRAHDGHPARPPRRPLRGRRGAPDMRGAPVSRALAGAAPWLAALLALAILPRLLPDWLGFLLTVAFAKAMVVLGVAVLLRSNLVSFGHGLYFAAGALAATRRWLSSPLGYLASAIRDNEIRVEYMGASVRQGIYRTYLLSGVLGGLGGCLVAFSVGHIAPEFSYWTQSGDFVFVTVLGGYANVFAPVMGSVVFGLVRHFAYSLSPHTCQLSLGAILLL